MAAPPADIQLEDLIQHLAPGTRLLGLDLGTKTIGLAISDLGYRIATPFHTIRRVKFTKDAEELLAICGKEKVAGMVLGLPINMNGTEGPRVQATRAFIRSMKPLTDIPFVLWDERLSTAAAERAMIEADMSRRKRAEKIDAAAAGFILQGALDRLSQLRSQQARNAL
ncbi:putative holliday junction resolvase [Faunimonas pinastri]|uniref:Putative pre-16S rRNA nuclease n=1 Tax=Faunimonas pinastri TaxID=1855383 RepID=A0A1H9CER6_9HYPH|nr:Holliday junction resolvase RuvX [Faunimonas pinastri]SEP99652.1 putative holliday junction resolvase [Faunimonas pinastri]